VILSGYVEIYDIVRILFIQKHDKHGSQNKPLDCFYFPLSGALVTYSKGSTKNLFAWFFKQNIILEIVGHTNDVNGLIVIESADVERFLTFSNDKTIILWESVVVDDSRSFKI
jgi:hypothetical protein